MTTLEPPFRDSLIELPRKRDEPLTGLLSLSWIDYFLQRDARVEESPQRLRRVSLVNQAAAIGTTPIPTPALSAGLYRLTVYARITTPATASSLLTVTLGFTDGAVSCSFAGAALTGNTPATVQSLSVLVKIDGATPLTYATAYASVGATAMKYLLEVVAERIA